MFFWNTIICYSMKSIYIICFILICGQAVTAQLTTNISWTTQSSMSPQEVIYYNTEKKLSWGNFLAVPPADNGPVAAITVSGFGYSADIKTSGNKGELNIKVYCYFNKNKSWVKPGKNTSYILNHEQHHFNISYIAACVFIDKLQNATFNKSNYNELLPRIYNESCDLMNKMQNDYDGQTKNGQVADAQEKWNQFINDRIQFITK